MLKGVIMVKKTGDIVEEGMPPVSKTERGIIISLVVILACAVLRLLGIGG